MERFKELNLYQKCILLALAGMALVFGAIYGVVSSRVGFAYMDEILLPSEENGNTVYSGTIDGVESSFTVTVEKEVTFRHGDRVYGPYTAAEDPSAIPEDSELGEYMTGIQVLCGDQIIYRGGALRSGGSLILYAEDGGIGISTIVMNDGTVLDINGDPIDEMEPSVYTILELMEGPQLTRKGQWGAWFGGLIISVLTAVSMLYADELFRWNLSFQIRNVEEAEPSDWEVAGRYIGWTALAIMVLVINIMGLK